MIILPEGLVVPLMVVHSITKQEAEARLQLLFKSSLMKVANPGDQNWQRQVDEFLALDSMQCIQLVAFDICLNECLNNKELVKQYDRLTNRNLTKVIALSEVDNPPTNAEKEFKTFAAHIRATIFPAFIKTFKIN